MDRPAGNSACTTRAPAILVTLVAALSLYGCAAGAARARVRRLARFIVRLLVRLLVTPAGHA